MTAIMGDVILAIVRCICRLNRTGYLVCRYLHEELNWPMDKAIDAFQLARGHDIERVEYLATLQGIEQATVLHDNIRPSSNNLKKKVGESSDSKQSSSQHSIRDKNKS